MGGRCIYCGTKANNSDHLENCVKYKQDLVPSPAGTKQSPEESPPVVTCGDETERPILKKLRIPPPQDGRSPSFPYKKPKPSKLDEFIFRCLACGNESCPYENGYSIFADDDGQKHEFDPCEPVFGSRENWGLNSAYSFEEVKSSIRVVVPGILRSSGFWSRNKFIGSSSLDFKLKTWMKTTKLDPRLVDKIWIPLRRTVKEALRYKRQRSVALIWDAYIG